MIPQTPLCVADRNTYWVRKLFCKNELLAAMCLADRVPLMARRAKSGICRNFGAESAHSGKIALTVMAHCRHSLHNHLTATTRDKASIREFLANGYFSTATLAVEITKFRFGVKSTIARLITLAILMNGQPV